MESVCEECKRKVDSVCKGQGHLVLIKSGLCSL